MPERQKNTHLDYVRAIAVIARSWLDAGVLVSFDTATMADQLVIRSALLPVQLSLGSMMHSVRAALILFAEHGAFVHVPKAKGSTKKPRKTNRTHASYIFRLTTRRKLDEAERTINALKPQSIAARLAAKDAEIADLRRRLGIPETTETGSSR